MKGHPRVFGVVGYPIKHSLSPHFQNAALACLGINAVYISFEIAPAGLKGAIPAFKGLGIRGLNITIPHKQAVIPLLDGISPEAKGIGAVNTVVFKAGRTKGYNTDGEGFIRSLKSDLRFDPEGKAVLLYGCGGAAQAVSFVLAREGAASIRFTDVDTKRAKALAAKTGKIFPGCKTKALPFVKSNIDNEVLASDLLVNTSPVGMHKGDPCIVSPKALHKGLAVYDIVYNPPATPVLKEAKKRGLKAMNGLGMLLYQGAISFELFTGEKAPIKVMRAALNRAVRCCH